MIDFRKLTLPHDLRSQLGLKDPVAIAQDICAHLNGESSVLGDRIAEQEAMRAEIGDALRRDVKPLDPTLATLDPLRRTIAAMGCLSRTKSLRTALAVNKLFSSTQICNQPINAPAPRTLTDILAHIKNLESDILEALVMAGANPHADGRRLECARTSFEVAFMMLKKAVDPEQERQ